MVKNRSNKQKINKKVNPAPRQVSRAPLAINTKTRNAAPRVSSTTAGTVVSHREILSDSVTVGATYNIASTIAVQPGLSVYSHGSPLGTWLPKIAAEYDNYCFESLKIHFTTSASSLQKGTILMAYDPNPDSAAPGSFSDLRNMAYAVTGPARENLTLDISSIVKTKKLLTRTRAVSSYPIYDAGRIFLGSTLGDGASVGYFEVEYKVRLMNPQTSPSTEQITVTTAPPTVVFTDDGTGAVGPLYFGATNASRCANALSNVLFRQPPIGDNTLITVNTPTQVYPAAGSVVVGGVTYSWAASSNNTQFTFTHPGRYRLSGTINGDWQDYAMFGASILRVSNSALAAASDRTITVSGTVVDLPVIPASWRGFSNPSGSGDDAAMVVDMTFTVLDTVTPYTFAVGVRNWSSVSENGTGSYFSGPTSYGASYLKLEYIGPLPAN